MELFLNKLRRTKTHEKPASIASNSPAELQPTGGAELRTNYWKGCMDDCLHEQKREKKKQVPKIIVLPEPLLPDVA